MELTNIPFPLLLAFYDATLLYMGEKCNDIYYSLRNEIVRRVVPQSPFDEEDY